MLTNEKYKIHLGDCREVLKQYPKKTFDCCVTSPPYFNMRDYQGDGQIGLEETPEEYVESIVSAFREVKRVLKLEGTCWVVIGDCYVSQPVWSKDGFIETGAVGSLDANHEAIAKRKPLAGRHPVLKHKDLVGIPWRVAFALQNDGWYLRSDIIWSKNNPVPEPVKSRPTRAHEYIFLLSRSDRYYYDHEAIKEPAESVNSKDGKRNKRSVWTVPIDPYRGAHFAVYPPRLIEPCILAGCPKGGMVLDPFSGAATTGVVCLKNDRRYVGVEVNQDYIDHSLERLKKVEAEL